MLEPVAEADAKVLAVVGGDVLFAGLALEELKEKEKAQALVALRESEEVAVRRGD